jgi:mono/diheme cytochrome c family protein
MQTTQEHPMYGRVVLTLLSIPLALLTSAASSYAAGAQDDAAKGQQVYAAQKCQMCHAIAGKGNKANPLDGVGTKLSAADTKAWIVTPVEMSAKIKSTKKPPMPAKYGKLPAADLDAMVAYLQSLK